MSTDNENGTEIVDLGEGAQLAEEDFVVVLAYTSPDAEIEVEFGQLVQDIKALYTFKNNVRVYAVVQDSAKRVLRQVEQPKVAPGNKAVMVVSYDLPEDSDEAVRRLQATAEAVRTHFEGQEDVTVSVGIRETADSVLDVIQADV